MRINLLFYRQNYLRIWVGILLFFLSHPVRSLTRRLCFRKLTFAFFILILVGLYALRLLLLCRAIWVLHRSYDVIPRFHYLRILYAFARFVLSFASPIVIMVVCCVCRCSLVFFVYLLLSAAGNQSCFVFL